MRILCVIESLGQGGAERQLIELALGFKKKGINTSFLVYHQNPFYYQILENENIPIFCINENNYLRRLFKMRRFIRAGNYTSIVSFLESSNFICEFAGFPSKKWKLIVGERSANPNIFKSVKLIIYRFFHFFADYVVANSHANMRMVRKINPLLSQRKCKVIYNIIDFKVWNPPIDFHYRSDGKIHIIISSSYRYLKNLDGLLEALKLLTPKEQSLLSIKWFGDVLDNSMYDGEVKIKNYELDGIITLFPATLEIINFTQEADIIGLFSFYEGFPNAICEGMACAKPVICSAISDMPAFIRNKSLLFDPKNHVSIANTLKYIIELKDNQLSEIGQENFLCARHYFEKEKIVNEYLQLLQ